MSEPRAEIERRVGALYREGQTMTAIAWAVSRIDGVTLTRNAIAGIIHRNGWTKNKQTNGVKIARPRQRVGGVSLIELTEATCHWPLDQRGRDGFMLFCGAPAQARAQYCDEHARRAYMSAQKKDRPL